jgi:hypothetical protein
MRSTNLVRTGKKTVSGYYVPRNLEKYSGPKPVKFLSSWELSFCKYCDLNENIVKWGKEAVKVQYRDQSRLDERRIPTLRSYIVDFFMEVKTGQSVRKILIEIKPYSQTIEPKKSPGKRPDVYLAEYTQYVRNMCKWSAAREAATNRGMDFIVLTENNLFKK